MNWQKKKIERSIKYQTRVFSEHINRVGSLAAAACHGLKLPL